MKLVLAVALMLALFVVLAGCGEKEAVEDKPPVEVQEAEAMDSTALDSTAMEAAEQHMDTLTDQHDSM